LEWTKTHPRQEVIARMIAIARRGGGAQDLSSLKYWQTFGVAIQGGVVQPQDFSLWIQRLEQDGRIPRNSVQLNDVYTNNFNPYQRLPQ
jgi:hypothetical protein